MADKDISQLVVFPSWGDHPDDFDEAIKPAYFAYPALAGDANFIIHRNSAGHVRSHDTAKQVKDGTAVVVVLGRGERVLDDAEVGAFEAMVKSLRTDKRISGRLKQTVNGGLVFDRADQDEPELPDNLDTTPPEHVTEAPTPAEEHEPAVEPEPELDEDDDDDGDDSTAVKSKP